MKNTTMWVFGCQKVNRVRGQLQWRLRNCVKYLIGIPSFFAQLMELSYFILKWVVRSTIGRLGTKLQVITERHGPRQRNWFLEIEVGEARCATSRLSYPMEFGLRHHQMKKRACGMPLSIAARTEVKAGVHRLSSL